MKVSQTQEEIKELDALTERLGKITDTLYKNETIEKDLDDYSGISSLSTLYDLANIAIEYKKLLEKAIKSAKKSFRLCSKKESLMENKGLNKERVVRKLIETIQICAIIITLDILKRILLREVTEKLVDKKN